MCDLKRMTAVSCLMVEMLTLARHAGRRRSLRTGDAFRNWKDGLSFVLDRSISTVLSRTQKTHLLLSYVCYDFALIARIPI